jgi:hypothetical protein
MDFDSLSKDEKWKQSLKRVFDDQVKLDRELGVPEAFVFNLIGEKDDWSFIVKLCAYFEAALTNVLAEKLTPKLVDVISNMPFSDNKSSKARMAKELGVISDDDYKFIRALAQTRNIFVHRIGNVTKSLDTLLPELKSEGVSIPILLGWQIGNGIDSVLRSGKEHKPWGKLVNFGVIVQANLALFHLLKSRADMDVERLIRSSEQQRIENLDKIFDQLKQSFSGE